MTLKMKYATVSIVVGIFLFLNFTGIETLQSQYLERQMEEGISTLEVPVDSAILLFNMAYINAVSNKDTALIIKSLLSLSEIKREQLDYSDAFDHSGEALFLSEEFGDTVLMAKSYDVFGMLNFTFYQEDEARKYIDKSCSLSRRAYGKELISSSDMIKSYYHNMLIHLRFKELDVAKNYLDTCYMISDTINQSRVDRARLDAKRATFLYHSDRHKEATDLMLSIAGILEDLKNTNDDTSDNKNILINIYTKLGEEYRKVEEDSLALIYLTKANRISKYQSKNPIREAYILDRLAWFQSKAGDFEKAYKNIKKSKNISETYFSAKRKRNSGFLKVKNRYREELVNKDIELNYISLQLAEREQSILRFRIFIVVFLGVLIFAGLIFRNKKQQKKYHLERESNSKKQQKSKELLEVKNKELTATTLKLIEKEEIIKTLVDQLNITQDGKMTDAMMNSINKSSSSLWEDFNNRFMSVNEDFYDRLRTEVPDLSPTDLKICALIKLNFSGKEMAHLLGISINSVHMARHRLRKKMDLERNINLSNFISSI